jgi:polysaccharide pyruvyl transferase CsaB
MTVRIGITGSYGGLNRGDEAILTSMVASLGDRVPDVRLTVFSRDADHTRAHHRVHDVVAARELTRDEVSAHVAPLDLLLLGGGGLLYDGEARLYLREVGLAQERGIRTMAYAVGAGPLSDVEDRRLICSALRRMGAVTVRDVGAKRILEQAGVTCPVEVTADPALLLEAEPFPVQRLAAEGVEPARALVGMSIREPGGAAPELDAAGYHDALAHAADYIVDRFDADVLFIPMEQCDIRLSHAVIARMVCADHAHVLSRRYRPGEMLGLMQHLDMVVGMRLHVLILAAVAGTPLMPLPYAAKVAEFARLIGMPAAAPVAREGVGTMLAAIDRAWDVRAQHTQRLQLVVPALQDAARRTLDVAMQCLEGAPAQAAAMSG